ncbi:O-antigen ligase family protein [Sphingomonas sp. Tas61C01]|uniref:O-antigen ligase family protein n=1 Tax=Sphingomonas sp. Tas61C01 TaxID=3458297 RepID=UPI00403ED825
MLAYVVVVTFFGGSSRYDRMVQIPVRLAAILVIAAATFRPLHAPSALRPPAVLLLLSVALVAVQLVPLPPEVWTALPGRDAFAALPAIAGFAQPWRPISIAPDLTVNSLLALTVPIAALYGVAALDARHQRWLWPILLSVIGTSLLVGLIQLTTGAAGLDALYQVQWRETASGLFANRNHQALLLAIGIPLLAAWEDVRRGDMRGAAARWSAGVALLLILVALLAMGSRAGLILGACGLAGAVAVSWSWYRPSRRSGRMPLIVGGAVAGVGGTVLALVLLLGRSESLTRFVAANPLSDKRARALPTVLDMIASYFPVGTGFGTFDPAFRRAEPFSLLEPTYFNQAHDDLIQVVLEGGLAGAILLAASLTWLGYAGVKLWRHRGTRGMVVRGRAAIIALVLTVGASAVDYPVRTPLIMVVVAALIFQVAAALDYLRQDGPDRDAAQKSVALPDG